MLLTIDIGNTNITCGVFNQDSLVANFRITTKIDRTSDEFGLILIQFLHAFQLDKTDIDAIVVCSVVPKMNHAISNASLKFFHLTPLFIGPGIKTGIQIKTDNPKEVGADRLVSVVAAHHLYHQDCLVIDFGTATTFDYVTENGEFGYTVICPGPQISANALWSQTAKLPEIEIVECQTILAKNTINGMQAGIYYGYKGLVENIIKELKEELKKPDLLVIATGGLGRLFAKNITDIKDYNPNLIFTGMKLLYDKNKDVNKVM